MYEQCLFRLTRESSDYKIEKKHLIAIKELMLFYKKLSENTFLGVKSSTHHKKEAEQIIEGIDKILFSKEFVDNSAYNRTLQSIKKVISRVETAENFNKKGDFAHIHEALKACNSGFVVKASASSSVTHEQDSDDFRLSPHKSS